MKNCREKWYDENLKLAVTRVDVAEAALALQNAHLMEDEPARYLSEGLAIAALLASETSEKDETVIVQMKCSGRLGGYVVECTSAGTLRGYTERKINVDGPLGSCRYQITRSVPGRIISQGIADSIDGYLKDSIQRKAIIRVNGCSGVMVEALPDSKVTYPELAGFVDQAEVGALKATEPLKFFCRCSPERAIATLKALPTEDFAALPDSIDITCHMCGRTFTINKAAMNNML